MLPNFACMCFYSMMGVLAVAVVGDTVAWVGNGYSFSHGARNVTASALYGWALFSAMLIPSCLVLLHRGFEDPYFEKWRTGRRGQKRPEPAARVRRWLRVSVTGLVVLAAAFLLVRCVG